MTYLPEKVGGCVVTGSQFIFSPGPCYYRGELVVAPTPWNLEQDWENPFSFRAGVEKVLETENQLIPFHTSPAPLLLLYGLEDSDGKGETDDL